MKHRLDETTLELFNNSLETCLSQPNFLKRFYEIFVGESPEVQDKFKATDMKKQIRILRKSMLLLTMASLETEGVDEEIARLGQSHGRQGMNIGPHLYELWLKSLLQAVSESDPAWSPTVGDSWRKVFEPYLNTLKSYSQ